MKKSAKREQNIMIAILVIFAAIALVGLLLALGAVSTGNIAWHAPATAQSCPAGWISAWAHSTNHTEMLNSGFHCTQSVIRSMVCCSH